MGGKMEETQGINIYNISNTYLIFGQIFQFNSATNCRCETSLFHQTAKCWCLNFRPENSILYAIFDCFSNLLVFFLFYIS